MELSEIAEESARGSVSFVIGTAASTVIGAVASILIARLLEPSGYGLYSLAFVLPALFLAFADFEAGCNHMRLPRRMRIVSGTILEFNMDTANFLFRGISAILGIPLVLLPSTIE
jgi:hypothetical protein